MAKQEELKKSENSSYITEGGLKILKSVSHETAFGIKKTLGIISYSDFEKYKIGEEIKYINYKKVTLVSYYIPDNNIFIQKIKETEEITFASKSHTPVEFVEYINSKNKPYQRFLYENLYIQGNILRVPLLQYDVFNGRVITRISDEYSYLMQYDPSLRSYLVRHKKIPEGIKASIITGSPNRAQVAFVYHPITQQVINGMLFLVPVSKIGSGLKYIGKAGQKLFPKIFSVTIKSSKVLKSPFIKKVLVNQVVPRLTSSTIDVGFQLWENNGEIGKVNWLQAGAASISKKSLLSNMGVQGVSMLGSYTIDDGLLFGLEGKSAKEIAAEFTIGSLSRYFGNQSYNHVKPKTLIENVAVAGGINSVLLGTMSYGVKQPFKTTHNLNKDRNNSNSNIKIDARTNLGQKNILESFINSNILFNNKKTEEDAIINISEIPENTYNHSSNKLNSTYNSFLDNFNLQPFNKNLLKRTNNSQSYNNFSSNLSNSFSKSINQFNELHQTSLFQNIEKEEKTNIINYTNTDFQFEKLIPNKEEIYSYPATTIKEFDFDSMMLEWLTKINNYN